MTRRSRRPSKNALTTAALQHLIDAAIERRFSPPANAYALPPAPPQRPLSATDPLMQQMIANQAPSKDGTTMFSPGAPLAPQPGLSPQGMPRQMQFPVGYNIAVRPRSTEATGFDVLRSLANLYDGIQLCEQVWLDTVAKLTLTIKPRPEITAEQGVSSSDTKYSAKIRKYTDFFAYPDQGNGYDLKTWLRTAVRDQLQIDAVAIYVRRNKGGGVYSLELVDGSSIKPLLDPRGRRPLPPYPAYQQFIYGVPAGLYTSEDMLYQRETTRTESIYGLSRVERIILRVNQALRKQNKDLSRFTDGNIPPAVLQPPDDGSQWTPEHLMAYQTMWDALLAGNDQARSRIKVVEPGSTLTPIDESDIFVDFDRFLLNVTCACYSMTMADLGFTENVNKSSGESQENVFYRRAVQPLMDRYAQLFTYILRHYFGEQDLIVSWSGFEESEDFNAMAASYVSLVNSGIVSPTTAAHKLNLPWSGPEIPNFVLTKDGAMFLEDAADPGLRKAANDAKMAGLQFSQQNPGGPPKPTNDDEQPDSNASSKGKATKSNGKQHKGDATPPGSGAKGSATNASTERAERPEILQQHTGMMVAFMLNPDVAKQLALPSGEPAEDLHVTLAFLGDSSDTTIDKMAVSEALKTIAHNAQPLTGNVGGIGRFLNPGNEVTPVYASVNIPGLQDFRRQLVEALEMAGCSVSKDFDFLPHITLAYIDADAPMPINDVPTLPLVFDELCLAIGDDRSYFPIGTSPRNDSSSLTRAAKPTWRPPSKTQISLEAQLAKAIKDYIVAVKLSKTGTALPDETTLGTLLHIVTTMLESAVHEGRRIATGKEERGLISAAKNLAGKAVQIISTIAEAIQAKAAEILNEIFGSSEVDDPEEAIAEAEQQLEDWAANYSEVVAITEIHAAVEDAVLDEATRSGATMMYWASDPDACPVCQANTEASPIPIGTTFPGGDTAPPAHPRCRCTLAAE